MQQLFQSVKTKKILNTLNVSPRSICLNWLAVLVLSATLLIMNAQFAHAQSDANIYYVRGGDTLTTIAFRHSISVQELMEANNLHSDLIHVGVRLTIPATAQPQSAPSQQQAPLRQNAVPQAQTASNVTMPVPQATVPQAVTQPTASNCSKDVYIAQRGDTLYSIAIRSNSNITRIKRCNNLHSDFVRAGQVLVGVSVPQNKQSTATCNNADLRCQPVASSTMPVTTALDSNSQINGSNNILN